MHCLEIQFCILKGLHRYLINVVFIHVHILTSLLEILVLSTGQTGLGPSSTGSRHPLQKRCPHSVCTGSLMALRHMGHSCLFRRGQRNVLLQPQCMFDIFSPNYCEENVKVAGNAEGCISIKYTNNLII